MIWRMGQQSTASCGNYVSGAHFLPLWSCLHEGLAQIEWVLGPLLFFFFRHHGLSVRPVLLGPTCRPPFVRLAQVVGSGGCSSLLLLSRRCRGGWFPPFFSLCRHEFVFWTHLCRGCMPCAPIFPSPFFPYPFIVFRVGAAFSLALATSSMCSPWFCFSHQAYLCSQGARLLGGLQTFLLWLLFPLSTARGGVQGVQTWCVNFLPLVFSCVFCRLQFRLDFVFWVVGEFALPTPLPALLQGNLSGVAMLHAPPPPHMQSVPLAWNFSLLWRCSAGGSY